MSAKSRRMGQTVWRSVVVFGISGREDTGTYPLVIFVALLVFGLTYPIPSSIMRTPFILALSSILLLSCSSTPPAPQVASNIERTVVETAISSGTPVTMADISIDGMTCEMMCGGAIKKALGALPGIASTDIKFTEGDERDHAIVTFDESKVNDAQMVEAIQALYDGQYKVLAVKITKQVKANNATSTEGAATKEEHQVSVLAPAVMILPGILSLLVHVLRL